MDRLQPLDAVFVDAEDQDSNTSMAIASIGVFDGPVPSHQQILTYVAGRLPLVPRCRHRLRKVPFRLGRPVWTEDPDFDLEYHVRRVALPAPGTDHELAALMARVMSERLDRARPLWEFWVVEGLAKGRWASIVKVHHCMVDGISGTDLYGVFLDTSRESGPPLPDQRVAAAGPSEFTLLADAARETAALPVADFRKVRAALAEPAVLTAQAAMVARAVKRIAPSVRPAVPSSLTGPIGSQRRFTWIGVPLKDIKFIKQELGGTVNDVVLAAISGGFRTLLLARGEQPQPHQVPSLVPVSLRAPGEEHIYENRVSATVADLPVHIEDPAERLTAVQAELRSLKESREATIGEALITLGRVSPYPVTSWWVRKAFAIPQREIVTVTTNVPGPCQPLYCMGRRLKEIIPYVPIASRVRIGVSIFSYCGKIRFGLTGDYTANPDLDVLADGIDREMYLLLQAARRHQARSLAA